jgi:3-mercaptopyruvate sulfurtransferase SseA
MLWILLLVVVTLAACQSAAPTETPMATATPVASQPESGAATIPDTRDEVPRITPDELRGLLASPRRIVVIDTRDRSEYEAAHIPGAIHMPSTEVEARYRELPRATKIITYCA